jgi:hypothetical protein
MDDNKRQDDHRQRNDQVPSKARPGSKAQDDYHPDAAKTQADDANGKEHQSLRRSWRASEPTAKLTIVFTGVIAIATALYAIFSGWTLYEIRRGSGDTHALAEAAKAQTEKMAESLRKTDILVDAATKSARAAQDGVALTRKSVEDAARSFQVGERAWLTVKEISIEVNVGGESRITARFTNTGKTPALHVRVVTRVQWGPSATEKPDFHYSETDAEGESIVSPTGETAIEETKWAPSPADVENLKSGKMALFVFGSVYYKDIFNRPHRTDYCGKFSPEGKAAFKRCLEHNGAY